MKADITTDLYFAVQAIESDELRELGRKLKQTPYRKLATFPANLEKMDSLPIGKIALLNYLTDRLTQRQFRQEASLAIEYGASEIELYWVESFFSWGSAKWQQLIEELANEGVVLRVMLDVVLLDEEQLTKVLGFLRACGVTDVGVSSGTMPDIVTPTQWRDYQRLFPSIFRLKVVGVKSKADADAFRSAGIRFVGTRELT